MEKEKSKQSEFDFPILVVEDNEDSRLLIANTLKKGGYELHSVTNGREALALFEDRFFPIVLSDWMMPEMDGLELCRAIRKQSTNGYVYIILLTAKDSRSEIVTGLEAGADDYLTKPFHKAELLARLNTAKRILKLEKTLKLANEEIKQLSLTDPLTGSYNRGYLTERVPKEIKRARRYQHPLSIIMCDIDRFKRINDTYGHEAGNGIIKAFVDCIRANIRLDIDWVARYGGEEFIIIVPETDIEGALDLAERTRALLADSPIEINGEDVRITASFGAVCFDPSKDIHVTLEYLVNRADQHLYECKVEGRNRVKGSTI